MAVRHIPLLSLVVLLVLGQGTNGLKCYSCTYVQHVGTMGNYLPCVLLESRGSSDPSAGLDVMTSSSDAYCVTRRQIVKGSQNVLYYYRGLSATDFGNGAVDYNKTIEQYSTTCNTDLCNLINGNPYLDNPIPLTTQVECLTCSYTSGGDFSCVSSPSSITSFQIGASGSACFVTATYTTGANNVVQVVTYERGLGSPAANSGPTQDSNGLWSCTKYCTWDQDCNGRIGSCLPKGSTISPGK